MVFKKPSATESGALKRRMIKQVVAPLDKDLREEGLTTTRLQTFTDRPKELIKLVKVRVKAAIEQAVGEYFGSENTIISK